MPYQNMEIKWLSDCKESLGFFHVKLTTKRKGQWAYLPVDWSVCHHEVYAQKPSCNQLTLDWAEIHQQHHYHWDCFHHNSKAKKWPLTKARWQIYPKLCLKLSISIRIKGLVIKLISLIQLKFTVHRLLICRPFWNGKMQTRDLQSAGNACLGEQCCAC